MSAAHTSGPAPQGGHTRQGFMLSAALAFLALVGLILPHGDSGEIFRAWLQAHPVFLSALAALWVVVILEGAIGIWAASTTALSSRLWRFACTSLLPPLRMVMASSTPPGWLWLPGVGWRAQGELTSMKLEQKLALPMVVLTLLVLPVLGAELTGGETLENHPRMALVTHLITCVIWVGFTAEFLWMVAAAPNRLSYCLRHWVNLVIILLPLVAFLRVLGLFRFARMLRAGKLLRAYRLRGLWARLWRLALLFNLLDRLQQRNPTKYCQALEKKIADMEKELHTLRDKLNQTRAKLPPPSA